MEAEKNIKSAAEELNTNDKAWIAFYAAGLISRWAYNKGVVALGFLPFATDPFYDTNKCINIVVPSLSSHTNGVYGRVASVTTFTNLLTADLFISIVIDLEGFVDASDNSGTNQQGFTV